jgi:hypothetical protein
MPASHGIPMVPFWRLAYVVKLAFRLVFSQMNEKTDWPRLLSLLLEPFFQP